MFPALCDDSAAFFFFPPERFPFLSPANDPHLIVVCLFPVHRVSRLLSSSIDFFLFLPMRDSFCLLMLNTDCFPIHFAVEPVFGSDRFAHRFPADDRGFRAGAWVRSFFFVLAAVRVSTKVFRSFCHFRWLLWIQVWLCCRLARSSGLFLGPFLCHCVASFMVTSIFGHYIRCRCETSVIYRRAYRATLVIPCILLRLWTGWPL